MSDANTASAGRLASIRESIVGRSRSNQALLLMAPLIAFELLIFVVPFVLLLRISLAQDPGTLPYAEGTWSLEAYTSVLTDGTLWSIVGYSFQIGVVVTLVSVTLGLLYAYAIWRSSGLLKSLLLFSVVLPLLTTLVIRTYAFRPLLSRDGTVNEVLLFANLVSEPLQFYPDFVAVVVGQTYIVFPYAVLAIYSVLATMDWHVVEAAQDLGASRPRSVLEVVVPQVMPGIIVAAVISFAWSVGSYAAPGMLDYPVTFAIHVEDLILSEYRYPEAAAISVVMLLLMMGSIAILFAILNRFGGEFDLA